MAGIKILCYDLLDLLLNPYLIKLYSSKDILNSVYVDCEEVISSLPNLESLVVCGFHYGDCVSKMEKKARDLEIPVFVDKALTNFYFKLRKQNKDVYSELEKIEEEIINFKLFNKN